MSKQIRSIEPKALWENFADLNSVPRPSKKEAKVIAFMKKFGEDLGLETIVDAVGNIIIKKPASKGLQKAGPVILQGHIDMVVQKNNDTIFDFNTMGINMYLDKDDLGYANDIVKNIDGTITKVNINREVVTIRGIIPGEYIINAHYYSSRTPNKIYEYFFLQTANKRESTPNHLFFLLEQLPLI